MSKNLSQSEIDALIAGMLSGEVDQATLDAAMAGSSPGHDESVAAGDQAAAPAPAHPAIADEAQVLVDLGPISQAEVDSALREAGKGNLIVAEPIPSAGIAAAPVHHLEAPPAAASPPPMIPAGPAPAAAAPPAVRVTFPTGPAASILMDLELVLTAELVRTRMRLNQLLGLQPGAVLELDRLANEPVDIIINGHQMMKAKVVTLGEYYGVQVTETRLQQPA